MTKDQAIAIAVKASEPYREFCISKVRKCDSASCENWFFTLSIAIHCSHECNCKEFERKCLQYWNRKASDTRKKLIASGI